MLGRQALVWRQPNPEMPRARRWAAAELALVALCGGWLLWRLRWTTLVPLACVATVLTLIAVWMMVHNRRRSLWLQLASAIGLRSSALLAALAARGRIEAWAWALWVLFSLHAAGGILVVRERLEARVRLRTGELPPEGPAAPLLASLILLGAGLALAAGTRYWLAGAALLSSGVHLWELARLRHPDALATPLHKVGLRALAVSLTFAALVTAGLR